MARTGDREEDRTLDAALGALAGVEPSDEADDARWAKRIAARVSTFAPVPRHELDDVLGARFPDGHQDQDFDHNPILEQDHTAAALAADHHDQDPARGWEGSMSEDSPSSRPPNSLTGLSGLTRSGPNSVLPDSFDREADGAAKGDDSGLIDLRAMNKTDEPPEVAAAAEVGTSAPAAISTRAPAPASKPVAAISGAKIPIASTASANAPASAAASVAAAKPAEKKKGAVIVWLGLGGVAAAAAAAFLLVGPMARKAEDTASSAPAASAPVEAKKENEKVASIDKPAASAAPTVAATEEPINLPGTPAHKGTAPGGGMGKSGTGPTATTTAAPPTGKPTASAAPDPANAKPGGNGSLDDVLGIGKDQPVAKKPETDNLPDKPESMDVRSAINGKVSSATSCVKGLDGPSNVSVTFGPGGAVSGVVVTSGPAKGTGAESCIKNAFSSAKVPASKKGATGSASLVP